MRRACDFLLKVDVMPAAGDLFNGTPGMPTQALIRALGMATRLTREINCSLRIGSTVVDRDVATDFIARQCMVC